MFEDLKVPDDLIPSDPRFGVGPSLIPIEHVQRLADTGVELLGTSHRKSAVKNLVKEVQEGIRLYFNLPKGHEVIIGNGGATFLFSMIGLGLVKKSSLHFVTGEFSKKWYNSHAEIPWIKSNKVEVKLGEGINPYFEEGHDLICCTLNETSTGVIVTDLPTIPKDHDCLLAVDATSGAGQMKVDFNKVDMYFFSPQKIFASEGGFYVAIMSPRALIRAQELYQTDHYRPEVMSWKHTIENSRKNQTYNTPAVSTIFLLNEQLKRMNKIGEARVIELATKKAKFMYDWVDSCEYLTCYIKDQEFRSPAVITINLDKIIPVDELTTKLRNMKIAYDIEGYRKLGENQLRISLFHNISLDDLKKLTRIISIAIENEINKRSI